VDGGEAAIQLLLEQPGPYPAVWPVVWLVTVAGHCCPRAARLLRVWNRH